MARILMWALSAFLVLVGWGCRPDCESACDKIIVECAAGIPSYNSMQCEADCVAVQEQYEAYDYYEDELEDFNEQLGCIMDASCVELMDPEAPACYNSALGSF